MVAESADLAALARRTALAPPYAHGGPAGRGRLRISPEDFRVDEDLGFVPDGGVAHVLLRIEKRGRDTLAVARDLAAQAGVAARDVGFAGLKDRHAVTTQWFTVPAARAAVEWRGRAGDGWHVVDAAPHSRKLRRGTLRGNAFRLCVREVEADAGALAARLAAVAARGVPNYFGPQRFGRDGGNLDAVLAWAAHARLKRGREQRAFVYSAARSLVFNTVLGVRVADATWDRLLVGELVNLDGRRSWFRATAIDAALEDRLAIGDVHPTGPLPGAGERPDGAAGELEARAAAPFVPVAEALATAGLEAARRPLRVRPAGFAHARDGATLTLEFALPAGAYATAVVRELLACEAVPEEADDA